MRKAAVVIGAFVLTLLAFPGPASADPPGELLELTCVGVPSGSITTAGNGSFTPGHDLGSTGIYVPYEIEFSVYFTPLGGSEILLDSSSQAKKAPNNAKSHPHGVCTFGGEELVDDPDLGTGVIRFQGSATVFYTGK